MRAHVLGFVALAVLIPLYVLLADAAGRPLALFALPPLLTAVLGGWRATCVVGAVSFAAATMIGILGPLSPFPLAARLFIILVAIVVAALAAWSRGREHAEVVRLTSASALYQIFQAGLLPAPAAPTGFTVVVRFVSSESQMQLGGDFLDAVSLRDGRLAVVIGDVCGHGPREAAFATAVRAGWRTVAQTQRPDPAGWLRQLDGTLFALGGDRPFVTMCTAIIDRAAGRAVIATAGHLAPIILGQRVEPAPVLPRVPLGLRINGPKSPWGNTAVELGGGLLLYTDGLLDNPTVDDSRRRWSEAGLTEWLIANADDRDPAHLADLLLAEAIAGRTVNDDVALLVVQPT